MKTFDEFVKIAKTKVQKMVDAGKIKDPKNLNRIFGIVPRDKDEIHKRINARAQKALETAKKQGLSDVKKAGLSSTIGKKMNFERYNAISTPKTAPTIHDKINARAKRVEDAARQKAVQGAISRSKKDRSMLMDKSLNIPKQVRLEHLEKAPEQRRQYIREALAKAGKSKKTGLSDITSENMTAKRYKKLSAPNNVKYRRAVDTDRQLKDMGRENSVVVRAVKKSPNTFPSGISVGRPTKGQENYNDPTTRTWWRDDVGPTGLEVHLNTKSWKGYGGNDPKRIAREQRGRIAAHEISGESLDSVAKRKAFNVSNLSANDYTMHMTSIGSHNSPRVLAKDAENLKRLSSATKKNDEKMRIQVGENYTMNKLINPAMADDIADKVPFSKNLKGTDEQVVRSMNDRMAHWNDPFLEGKLTDDHTRELYDKYLDVFSSTRLEPSWRKKKINR